MNVENQAINIETVLQFYVGICQGQGGLITAVVGA
jgi:hypothetical protein